MKLVIGVEKWLYFSSGTLVYLARNFKFFLTMYLLFTQIIVRNSNIYTVKKKKDSITPFEGRRQSNSMNNI